MLLSLSVIFAAWTCSLALLDRDTTVAIDNIDKARLGRQPKEIKNFVFCLPRLIQSKPRSIFLPPGTPKQKLEFLILNQKNRQLPTSSYPRHSTRSIFLPPGTPKQKLEFLILNQKNRQLFSFARFQRCPSTKHWMTRACVSVCSTSAPIYRPRPHEASSHSRYWLRAKLPAGRQS